MAALLDVNVLVALFDSAHVHHEAAHTWFGANRKNPWATCALTENAFVVLLTRPTLVHALLWRMRPRVCEHSAPNPSMFSGRIQ